MKNVRLTETGGGLLAGGFPVVEVRDNSGKRILSLGDFQYNEMYNVRLNYSSPIEMRAINIGDAVVLAASNQ